MNGLGPREETEKGRRRQRREAKTETDIPGKGAKRDETHDETDETHLVLTVIRRDTPRESRGTRNRRSTRNAGRIQPLHNPGTEDTLAGLRKRAGVIETDRDRGFFQTPVSRLYMGVVLTQTVTNSICQINVPACGLNMLTTNLSPRLPVS